MHGDEKSDPSIVAGKPANGLGRPGPELVEQREGAKENTGQASSAGRRAGQACPLDWTVYGQRPTSASPSKSKVGAGCGNAARPVLVQRG